MTKDPHQQDEADIHAVYVIEEGDDDSEEETGDKETGKGSGGGFADGAGALTAKEVIGKDRGGKTGAKGDGDYYGVVEEGLREAGRIAAEKGQRVEARTVLAEKMAAALERMSNDTLHKLFQAGLIDTRTAQKLGLIARTITSILSAAVDTVAVNLLSYEQKAQIENRGPQKPNAAASIAPPRHDL